MRASKAIRDRCLRIVTHACATNEVGVARFLYDLLSSGCVHNLHCFFDASPGNLAVVVVQAECHLCDLQSETVGVVSQLHAVVFMWQNFTKRSNRLT